VLIEMSMLLAREMVRSMGSVPPAGESLMTRILVIGLLARRFESISSAIISQVQGMTHLD
jgi:hypothetical protein